MTVKSKIIFGISVLIVLVFLNQRFGGIDKDTSDKKIELQSKIDKDNDNDGNVQIDEQVSQEVTKKPTSTQDSDIKSAEKKIPESDNFTANDEPEEEILFMKDPGKNPPVPSDANAQVKSVMEALQSKSHPERLSPVFQPKPFNLAEYKNSPQSYLNTVEPGRVFQSAAPREGVKRIKRIGSQYVEINGGESTVLTVETEPEMPVTFTSFDLGRFENSLTSISVKADGQGIAKTKFIASKGTFSNVNILAASPVSSGRVKFIVNIKI